MREEGFAVADRAADPPRVSDIPGLRVGHATDLEALTGCTVLLTPEGAVGGVDVRGAAPGTRETDLLDPVNVVERVNAVVLAGGSAFGLEAATGVVRWLEERGYGFEAGFARVPIVPATVLFDLGVGRADRRPDAPMGYAACEDAWKRGKRGRDRRLAESGSAAGEGRTSWPEGNVGAGTGASVGKLLGPSLATKSGLGTACLRGPGGLLVGAVVAVNAFGDVRDPATGAILAGTRNPSGGWLDTAAALAGDLGQILTGFGQGGAALASLQHTTIGAVATNGALTKVQASKVAQMAHDGLALAISPVHTMFDGDTLFALSCGQAEEQVRADVSVVGTLAARAVAGAVVRAVLAARPAGGLPAAVDLGGETGGEL